MKDLNVIVNSLVFTVLAVVQSFGVDFSASEIVKESTKPNSIERPTNKKLQNLRILQKDESVTQLDEIKITVNSFVLDGNYAVKTDELLPILSDLEKKELTLSMIYDAAERITKEYEKRGYFAAKAYIPEQEIGGGVVKIKILEGKYGEIEIKNNSLVRDMIAVSVTEKLKKEKILSTKGLERTLILLNETPGVKVKALKIKEGKKPEEGDVEIELSKTDRFGGYIMYDNYGGKYIGKNRLRLATSMDSPTKIGDRLELSGLISNGGLIKNYTLGYDLPLDYNGLRALFEYSSVSYKLSGEYTELNAIGKSERAKIGLSYPFIKNVETELTGNLSVDGKKLKDEIRIFDQSTRKKGVSTSASLLFSKKLGDFEIGVSGSITGGKIVFDDKEAKESDDSGAAIGGLYAKTNGSLSVN